MARKRRFVVAILVGTVLLLAGLAGVAWYAAHRVPEFYVRAVAMKPEEQKHASDVLVRRTATLSSDLRKKENRWQALFTAEQINAWLAVDLPRNFAHALPPSFSEPRVDIRPGAFTAAVRYEGALGMTVLSVQTDLFLPQDQPETVAIRIKNVTAGSLPIGKSTVIDALSHAAREADWVLQWRQIDGDPVAYLSAPTDSENPARAAHLDKLELRDGEIFFSGHTGEKGE